ncbi:hypothetical protein I9W82_002727 [Candida metapsilosis]|uniref:ER membrane protein complex subunit 10 n=1 Tax=Candida metapsilosis TaxID=273372 RepID=A0A8H8DE82_9ASCO|nr:hypothetical protein I9W82_002727 [Candida metapsilosis]
MNSIIQLALIAFIATLASSKRINLFIKPIDQAASDPIGFIENEAVYLMDVDLQPDQAYCIGTKDVHNNECFSYQTNLQNLNHAIFNLYLDGDGDISRLSLSFDDKLDKPQVKRRKQIIAAQPNLNPDSMKKQREEQKNGGNGGQVVEKVKQKKVITEIDANGVEVTREIEEEVEVPVDDRSWIQKNWMYIVPPLLIFMLAGGGGAEQGR